MRDSFSVSSNIDFMIPTISSCYEGEKMEEEDYCKHVQIYATNLVQDAEMRDANENERDAAESDRQLMNDVRYENTKCSSKKLVLISMELGNILYQLS